MSGQPGLRRLRPADYRRMPWRNGGGMTTEIATEPHPDRAGAFLWRLSIADVEADGPFSAFPGYERTILLLAGNGMRLDAGPQGVIELTRPLEPQRFSGDWQVSGRLRDGPVKDFNLMVARDRVEGSVEVLAADGGEIALARGPDELLALHVFEGRLGGVADAAKGDTLIVDGLPDGIFALAPEPGSTLILARIRRCPGLTMKT